MTRPQSVTKRVNFVVVFLCSDVRMVVEVNMKKWLVAMGFLVLLTLDWAALHDIVKVSMMFGWNGCLFCLV